MAIGIFSATVKHRDLPLSVLPRSPSMSDTSAVGRVQKPGDYSTVGSLTPTYPLACFESNGDLPLLLIAWKDEKLSLQRAVMRLVARSGTLT